MIILSVSYFGPQQRQPKYIKKFTSNHFQYERQVQSIQWSIRDRINLWTTFYSLTLWDGCYSLFDGLATLFHTVIQKKKLAQSKRNDLSLCLLKIAENIAKMQELFLVTDWYKAYNFTGDKTTWQNLNRQYVVLFSNLMHNFFIKSIAFLYMFPAILCSSSGGLNCICTASGSWFRHSGNKWVI